MNASVDRMPSNTAESVKASSDAGVPENDGGPTGIDPASSGSPAGGPSAPLQVTDAGVRSVGGWSGKRFTLSLLGAIAAGLVLALLFTTVSAAGNSTDLAYNALDYDVTVLPNGDLRVKERIDMSLRAREDGDGDDKPWRQLYQRYRINPENLTGISDVSVRDVDRGKNYPQTVSMNPSDVGQADHWDEDQADSWYIAQVEGDDLYDYEYERPKDPGNPTPGECQMGGGSCQVEIGWNIPELKEADSRVFELAFTMHGVSTAYDDVTAFQWEPVGTGNQTQIGKLSGVIHLPQGEHRARAATKAWLHYTGPSSDWRDAGGDLHFQADRVSPGQFLDVKVIMDRTLTRDVPRVRHERAGQRIAGEEDRQEAAWRRGRTIKARLSLALWTLIAAVTLAMAVLAIRSAFRSFRSSRYAGPITYWRQAPQMSPAAAAELNTVMFGGRKALHSRQMAATVLSLASKGAIAVYPGPVRRYAGLNLLTVDPRELGRAMGAKGTVMDRAEGTSTIVIRPVAYEDVESLALANSELAALALLKQAAERLGSRVFDLKQMQDSFSDYHDAWHLMSRFDNAVAVEFGSLAATRSLSGSMVLEFLGVVAALGLWALGPATGQSMLGWICGAVLLLACAFALGYGRPVGLTGQGQEWAGQVAGLRAYLLDFSSFRERGVESLALWDVYLVYATALGISKEAMRELAKAYPQVTDSDWLDAHYGGLLYMSYRPYGRTGGWGSEGPGLQAVGRGFSAGIGDLGGQLSSGFSQLQETISAAGSSGSSGGSFGGGGFGGSSGGSGGGSFGGR
ncbi:DUF2207 domain-containing protein [Bifidobacterium xylocopae]|uniref:DUF2207 domain-containing protein n=1 Tax=Bifidobacterium xylocopae TaxID=2493119 RepID=A0A366KC91_9BIFI|nr:DUF2207 domain-containing protein [Bifidobacterium xylocopae]RBP99355.1 hypothetical protein CRD59_03895 [Bifidobacterium xylocopae]